VSILGYTGMRLQEQVPRGHRAAERRGRTERNEEAEGRKSYELRERGGGERAIEAERERESVGC
jgi:hypothetical protein